MKELILKDFLFHKDGMDGMLKHYAWHGSNSKKQIPKGKRSRSEKLRR